jgi:hypothetical protein
MMERETLAYGAPLYGRRTGQLALHPLSFSDFSQFFPGLGFDRRFAEAKWSSKKVGVDIFQALKEQSKLVQGNFRRRHYALLSRSGFTAAMERLAREQNVLLIHGETKV